MYHLYQTDTTTKGGDTPTPKMLANEIFGHMLHPKDRGHCVVWGPLLPRYSEGQMPARYIYVDIHRPACQAQRNKRSTHPPSPPRLEPCSVTRRLSCPYLPPSLSYFQFLETTTQLHVHVTNDISGNVCNRIV